MKLRSLLVNRHFRMAMMVVALLFFLKPGSYAQNNKTSSLSGHVIGKETHEPEVGCVVVLVELNMWSMTDAEGAFLIEKIPTGGTYTIKTSSLGLESFEKKMTFADSKTYIQDITLARMTFEMDEVVVVAQDKKGLGSSSTISQVAMEHLQPASLKDIMQLVPGQISSNPDLSSKAQLSIRDIGTDANSSLGTAIIVDGAPISNNADMQVVNTSNSTVDGGGVDVRQIATNNIESVEVIRGIASVQYGDLTSGAVIVKTKAGATPWDAKVTLNPNMKKAYVGKGLRLNNNAGALNFNVDYTSSIDSKIRPYEGFERISAQLGYSKTLMKESIPLTFNVISKYFQTIDSEKTDPDFLSKKEEYRSSDRGINLGVHGKWNLKKWWITNLDYSFNARMNFQELYTNKIVNGNIEPVTNARKDTVMVAEYLPSQYSSELTVDGRPFNLYAKMAASKIIRRGQVLNNILYGFDYRSSGNNGKGRMFDELRPPLMGGNNATRPRPYSDIPSLSQFSLFLSNNLTLPLGSTCLFLEAGLRFNNYQPTGFFKGEIDAFVEPRINLKYELLNKSNNHIFDKFSLFGGYGIHSKSPTSIYLYPDVAYYDLNSLNYYSLNPAERLALVSTRVIDTSNPDLKPITNDKYELGIEGSVHKFNFRINAYYEDQHDGLSFDNQPAFLEFGRWIEEDPNIIFQEGAPPVVDLMRPSEVDTFIALPNRPANSQSLIKKGVEYVVNFGEVKAIKTHVNLMGAYLKTKSVQNTERLTLPDSHVGTQLPWVGVYPAGGGTERIRFNTNLTAITHIPKLRLIFSTTLQVIWKNSSRYFFGGGQPWEYINAKGDQYLVDAPIALIDKAGIRREVSREEILTPTYDYYLGKYSSSLLFDAEEQPVHYQLNMKLTSEIGDAAKFSFFANNFTMHNPRYTSKRTNNVFILNSPLFFGLELTFLF